MELKDLRDRLDQIDDRLTALFCQRMETVRMVADYKRANKTPILAAGREQEILDRVTALAGDELQQYTKILFTTLMELSRDYQAALLAADTAPRIDSEVD